MWRIIEEFPNYIINEYGTIYKVYGKNNLRIMKPKLDKDGYLYLGLRNDKGRYFRRVHQLVAKAFLSNPNNYEVVNHMDGNIKNNHFTNLEWCTVAYNTRYSYTHLGRKGNHTTDIKCKLKVDNEVVGEFRSIKEAAEYANIRYKASKSSLIKYYKFGNISIEKCND